MHKEILTKEQVALLPLVKAFKKKFRLVGGTAVALQIGHRHSIDFDLFSRQPFKNSDIRKKVKTFAKIDQEIVNHLGEFTFLCEGVKFTFYHYRFDIEYEEDFGDVIKMPNLLTLAAMKVHALAGRAKWKDYVDLYFILTKFYNLSKVTSKTKELFQDEFNEKLFRAQLGYFDDINYAEKVEYLPGFEVPDDIVKQGLIDFSLE